MNDDDLQHWWDRVVSAADDERDAVDAAYQHLENAGLVSKVVVHRYLCRKRGCVLATVIRVVGITVARSQDYKLSPGKNVEITVEAARQKNTLDGDRHWPGHTFDVNRLASWGPEAGLDVSCRHGLQSVLAVDILAATAGVKPGHPGKPTRL